MNGDIELFTALAKQGDSEGRIKKFDKSPYKPGDIVYYDQRAFMEDPPDTAQLIMGEVVETRQSEHGAWWITIKTDKQTPGSVTTHQVGAQWVSQIIEPQKASSSKRKPQLKNLLKSSN